MDEFHMGELVKTVSGVYALVVGGKSLGQKGNIKTRIYPILNRGKIELYPTNKLKKVEPSTEEDEKLTEEDEKIKQELVDMYNKYFREKIRREL